MPAVSDTDCAAALLPVIYTDNAERLEAFYGRLGLLPHAAEEQAVSSLLIVSPACGLPGLHLALAARTDASGAELSSGGLRFASFADNSGPGGIRRLALPAGLRFCAQISVRDIIQATKYCLSQGLRADTSRISMGIVSLHGSGMPVELHLHRSSGNSLRIEGCAFDWEGTGAPGESGRSLQDPDGNELLLSAPVLERVY